MYILFFIMSMSRILIKLKKVFENIIIKTKKRYAIFVIWSFFIIIKKIPVGKK